MGRLNRNTKYYIPGAISLIILPVAFYFFAKREIRQSTLWAMPLVWVDTAHLNKLAPPDASFNTKFPPERNYTDIVFTGNQSDDRTRLAFSQIQIKQILNADDTLNGIHFLFGDSSTYGTVAGVFDNLQAAGAERYLLGEKDIWFWQVPPDTVKPLQYECLLCNDVVYGEPEISWWTKTKGNLIRIWITSWQLIVLYASFLILIVALWRKRNVS